MTPQVIDALTRPIEHAAVAMCRRRTPGVSDVEPDPAFRFSAPRAAVWVPILLNIVWAAECLFVIFGATGVRPTLLGEAFIAVQVVAVLVFAELEYMGLRRACAIVVA